MMKQTEARYLQGKKGIWFQQRRSLSSVCLLSLLLNIWIWTDSSLFCAWIQWLILLCSWC